MKPLSASLTVAMFFALLATTLFSQEVADAIQTLRQAGQQISQDPAPLLGQTRPQSPRGIYKSRISPHWFSDNSRFWYRNDLKDGAREFVVVDSATGNREAAFDHSKLAKSLNEVTNENYPADRLPFRVIRFCDDGNAVQFAIGKQVWQCQLDSYQCTQVDGESVDFVEPVVAGDARLGRRGGRPPMISPDGSWIAAVRDHDLHICAPDGDDWIPLSTDGIQGNAYGNVQWSPDSNMIVAFRIQPGDNKQVHLIKSTPENGGRAELTSRPYALPGDKFDTFELNLFDIKDQKQIKPDLEAVDFGFPRIRWKGGSGHFTFEKVDRGHQRYRLIDVDSHTGATFNIIDEQTETFIWTAHTEDVRMPRVNWLEKTDEIVYYSERDGWRHLYLVDSANGGIKNQITKGNFVVRSIDQIDEEKRQIWFTASGMSSEQDPYLIHYFRINFDGSDLVALTEGNGNHVVQFSPDRSYLIDTYSRVDLPPVHELRRASDGGLLCRLEQADISELQAQGFRPPEVFTAKGRDGKTDIWGVLTRPVDFDPNKKYPIIESIYAGPQGSFVPKSFSTRNRYSSLANRGYIVVQIDGMGTANRSKAFHDVCWKNLKDAGFPDRILWIKAAAEKYPFMDISRVGVYGTSAGGQNAAGALLFHPEFYKVASANCGCHDNRMDKSSWNEQWMGYPVGPQYSECSNIDNAGLLQGHLLLIHGEVDTNVPPESTLRFVDALVKADKDFELIFIPGGGHGAGQAGSYHRRRMYDFFARHLQGADLPNHNAPQNSDSDHATQ